ncbi:MAG TPA: site-specific integrase [Steroidobacteraceae bacterium]|nr:site-specific integrase [Steroidobacteraceae bacterium]
MARTVRGGSIETRAARLRLAARPRPYWAPSGKPGLHLGYRRLAKTNGSWIVRRYQGKPGDYDSKAFAQADDFSDADGSEVLTYFQAVGRLSGEAPPVRHSGEQYDVRTAVVDYVTWLKTHKKTSRDAELKLNAYLIPVLGDRPLVDLKPEDFDRWLSWAVDHKPKGRRGDRPPKLKQKRGASSQAKAEPPKPVIDASERKRRKRSTLNRVINNVKACLNRAFQSGHVSSDAAWRRLKKFKRADAARSQWLTVEQCKRLINAAAPDFRPLVHAAMLTGARWGELRALKFRDYDPVSGTINIAESKSGKPRRVYLTDAGKAAFESWTAAGAESDVIFKDRFGNPWGSHDQHRPMAAACEAARIEPAIGMHTLRHSYASALVQAGVSLAIVAEALGHADTRMVSKHYGHLAPSHIADAIRSHLPSLGIEIEGTVTRLRREH